MVYINSSIITQCDKYNRDIGATYDLLGVACCEWRT